MCEVLEEAHELVDDGLMTAEDFRDFAFVNPAGLWASMNPDFFKGTVVEDSVAKVTGKPAKAAEQERRNCGEAPCWAAPPPRPGGVSQLHSIGAWLSQLPASNPSAASQTIATFGYIWAVFSSAPSPSRFSRSPSAGRFITSRAARWPSAMSALRNFSRWRPARCQPEILRIVSSAALS